MSTAHWPHVPLRHLYWMLHPCLSAASSKMVPDNAGMEQDVFPCLSSTMACFGITVFFDFSSTERTGGFSGINRVSLPRISEPTVHFLFIVSWIGKCADGRWPLNAEYSRFKHTEWMIHPFFAEIRCFKVFRNRQVEIVSSCIHENTCFSF